ncbi:tetratricopeptide repeat protein [Deinococcus cellulosilyticus]|uniref:Tetratricopeptide repeat protein n=1 Tax=Deinococcus cellulosilyticus (strain DSM 18568 / NBRC 106333 / KACC 11606 / 5516J-15) TaxID=1223518 RepID=A0A511N5P1_DEIC1|nr:tetratricopeptide repeat protein [Deinococcus cellulosilyticus]GEM48175.1 hypothetical protein DC3_38100 [Deinococcus cellulosilyticus NBRC 106333 = KACC 11606]
MEWFYALTANLWPIISVLQIAFIVHALITRRQIFWFFLLLFVPVISVILYLFMEVLPDARRSRVSIKPVLDSFKSADARIRERQEALDEINTPENRRALAQAYLQAGRMAEAEQTLEPLLTGIYRDDPLFQYEVAQIKFLNGKPDEARGILQKLLLQAPHELKGKARILMALTLEKLGDAEGARQQHLEAIQVFSGEEARYRYAEFLVTQGEKEEAGRQLDLLLKSVRKASPTYRRQEREWETQAQKLKQTLQA